MESSEMRSKMKIRKEGSRPNSVSSNIFGPQVPSLSIEVLPVHSNLWEADERKIMDMNKNLLNKMQVIKIVFSDF